MKPESDTTKDVECKDKDDFILCLLEHGNSLWGYPPIVVCTDGEYMVVAARE